MAKKKAGKSKVSKVSKVAKSSAKAKLKKAAAKGSAKKAVKAAPKKAEVKAAPKKPVPTPPKKPTLVTPKNSSSRQYTQSEFFDCIQGYCGFQSRREAKDFYANFSGMIQSALKSGFKLVLPGLGKMQVRRTKARKGINPATREPINIPARKKVAFTANKALKEAVL
ncbi:MAG: HU family DNA-binding protein [Bdellovibrionota bacterium]